MKKVCGVFFIFTYQYAVIGGDMRQKILFEKLSKDYKACVYYGVNELLCDEAESLEIAMTQAKTLLLPIPMCKGEQLNIQQDKQISKSMLLEYIQNGQYIFGGCIPEDWKELAEEKGAKCFDYMKEKTIAIYNSIATAEGTIAEMIRTYPKNLHGEKVLVLGFGTCAKTLASKLKAFDMNVTIAARNEQALMEAYVYGYETVPLELLDEVIDEYPLIVNTIPARVLSQKTLERMKKQAVLYEIASMPYSFSEEEAKKVEITYYICPALPAKYAPVSSAEMLREFIERSV